MSDHKNDHIEPDPGRFPVTDRNLVLAAAGNPDDTLAREAFGRLYQVYYYPLYAFVRRQGYDPHKAEDLTQSFFVRLLEKGSLAAVDPARGKFRTFLLAALKYFLASEWHHQQAEKEGGKNTFVPIDAETAETRYCLEMADHNDPEKIYEKNWAMALLEKVFARLRMEQEQDGKLAQFDALKVHLMGDEAAPPYAELAVKLGETEVALRMAAHRLKKRFRKILRAEIKLTVGSQADIEEEIRHLFAALAN